MSSSVETPVHVVVQTTSTKKHGPKLLHTALMEFSNMSYSWWLSVVRVPLHAYELQGRGLRSAPVLQLDPSPCASHKTNLPSSTAITSHRQNTQQLRQSDTRVIVYSIYHSVAHSQ